ncbi:MAG: STAS domain-containing protein [Clostridia bacterium]|nr:STAS domain-containing protein [Clostridia bacterium]
MLNINEKVENGKAIIALEGRLDTVTAPDLESAVKKTLPGLTELTFDFKDLEYISSAGLRVLLSVQKVMMAQGSMKVCNVNETVMEVFEVTGFADILTIE